MKKKIDFKILKSILKPDFKFQNRFFFFENNHIKAIMAVVSALSAVLKGNAIAKVKEIMGIN